VSATRLNPLDLTEYRGKAPERWRCNSTNKRRRRVILGALKRAGFRCEFCHVPDGLTVHHEMDRGEIRILCIPCHLGEHE
jgi:hypothetical protein